MRDFDDKALILFPNLDFYENASLRWRYLMQSAIRNLDAYLRSIGMTPHAFLTDDLARELPDFNPVWVSTLNRGDMFFIQQNCGIPKKMIDSCISPYEDIIQNIAQKDPMEPNLSPEDRFEHITKRDKKAITSIVPAYKVVVNFYKKNETRYRVVVKPNGGKIRIIVDASSFLPTAYINNIQENPIDLLGIGFGNKSLVNWEVTDDHI